MKSFVFFLILAAAFGQSGLTQQKKPLQLTDSQFLTEDDRTFVAASVLQEHLGLVIKEIENFIVLCTEEQCVRISTRLDCTTKEEGLYVAMDKLESNLGLTFEESSSGYSVSWKHLEKTSPSSMLTRQGQKFPDFSLPDLNGKQVRLSDFHGKRILLVCWASW